MIDNGVGGKFKGALVIPEGVQVVQLSNTYTYYPIDKVLAAIRDTPIKKYIPESFNYDNYYQDIEYHVTHELSGCPFGFALGKNGSHAVNVFWASDRDKVKRYYYDATSCELLEEFDVSFILV